MSKERLFECYFRLEANSRCQQAQTSHGNELFSNGGTKRRHGVALQPQFTTDYVIASTIFIVGSEQTIWRKWADSQGLHQSWKYVDLYCVENDQEDGVISDLEKIICHRLERRNSLLTQEKINVPPDSSVTGKR